MKRLLIIVLNLLFVPVFGATKIVRMPKPANLHSSSQTNYDEILDLEIQDPMALESFSDLIKATHKRGQRFIVARVLTQQGSVSNIHYYDAHQLNKALFGQYPLVNSESNRILYDLERDKYISAPYNYRNPSNNEPIRSLDYFILQNPNDEAFEYLCPYYELFGEQPREKVARLTLYSNQSGKGALRTKSQYELGTMYYLGKEISRDFVKARGYYEQLLKEKISDDQRVHIRLYLGVIYRQSTGDEQHYDKAFSYFKSVEDTQVSDWVRYEARAFLGEMYYLGLGVDKDVQRAKEYFISVHDQTVNKWAQSIALLYLGFMLYNAQQYLNARVNFEIIEEQKEFPDFVVEASFFLGTIYHYGLETNKNLTKAREYYQYAINQDINPSIKEQAQEKLDELDQLESAEPSHKKAKK